MATTQPAAKTTAPKKEPVAPFARINDPLRHAAAGNKLTADELDKLAQLAGALKILVSV